MTITKTSNFNEDDVRDLRLAFDPDGTLESDLREIWTVIKDGVDEDVRRFCRRTRSVMRRQILSICATILSSCRPFWIHSSSRCASCSLSRTVAVLPRTLRVHW